MLESCDYCMHNTVIYHDNENLYDTSLAGIKLCISWNNECGGVCKHPKSMPCSILSAGVSKWTRYNDPKHTSCRAQAFFEENRIKWWRGGGGGGGGWTPPPPPPKVLMPIQSRNFGMNLILQDLVIHGRRE